MGNTSLCTPYIAHLRGWQPASQNDIKTIETMRKELRQCHRAFVAEPGKICVAPGPLLLPSVIYSVKKSHNETIVTREFASSVQSIAIPRHPLWHRCGQ